MRYRILCLWLCLLLLVGCAKIVVPTGGPRDVTPPSVSKVEPESGTTNFKAKQIKITFDEFVELNNPLDNTLVSPPLNSSPEFIVSGKSLIMKIKDTLQSNRTYNIVFSDCIKDFTEGNKLSYFHYTFSTGDFVDSFYLRGTVTNALTLKPEGGCLVFLYSQEGDSLPMTTRPEYITKTSSDGLFEFSNIAENSYQIFALKDLSSNLLYDMSGEGIAFADERFQALKMLPPDTSSTQPTDSLPTKGKSASRGVKRDSTSIDLQFFIPADTVQKKYKATNPQKGIYQFPYSLPLFSFEPEVIKGVLPEHFVVQSELGDTVTWYMKSPLTDTVSFVVQPTEGVYDTLTVLPYKKTKSSGGRGRQRNAVQTQALTVKTLYEGDLYKPLTLRFSYPIKPVDNFEVMLVARKKSGNDTIHKSFSVPDAFVMSLPLPFKLEEKVPYTLLIRDSIFYGYDGLVNDTIKVQFTTKSEKDYGNLAINYVPDQPGMSYVVELLGVKDAVIQKNIITGQQTVTYDNLIPGSYKIRVVEDRNRNGRWDTGNYFKKEQPEVIFFFNKPLEIRGFWDLEETFDFKEVRTDKRN
ncbi:MAG: Ig-like domain-containing protein [Bacteroidales bacterium]|nr:Ig-like domain-containing protein [Bacteroidales bacterium]